MERHSFFELVKDYESLGGNDYVHKVILPAMNQLDVISMEKEKHLAEDAERDRKIKILEEAVNKYPAYREQSLVIQQQLKQSDVNILEVCNAIKEDVVVNRQMLDSRLKSLEKREKNALREKILDLYRKFTDDVLNPMLA
jgi:hypothetical protein